MTWKHVEFNNMEAVTEFLNQLPEERALEAKVSCWSAGLFYFSYVVWYRA